MSARDAQEGRTGGKSVRRVLRTAGLLLVDAMLAWLSMLMAVRWRIDSMNETMRADIDHKSALVAGLVTLAVWVAMRQERAIWRFTSLADFRRLLVGVVAVMLIVPLVLFLFFDRGAHFPRLAPFIGGALFALGIVGSRLIVMLVQNGDFRALWRSPSFYARDAILIGTASNIYNYLRDTSRRPSGQGFNPIGLIETTGQYSGRSVRSVPILGELEDLPALYPTLTLRRETPLHLLSLDPTPDREQAAELVRIASDLGAPLSRFHRRAGEGLSQFEASDLIGREPRKLDMVPVSDMISGKRVLVTGAGGSIGSELSEQIARLAPSHLALIDNSELNLYQLERRLARAMPDLAVAPWRTYLADVCNRGRMSEIFEAERPEVVLHAAAFKHVPLGERNPVETLRTNILGTAVTLDMCEVFEVDHFVLISTDKAVEPINVMGASKRVVELLTLARQSQIPTMHASAVRFGNVLGSTGSVVRLFEEQIALGGPVTVTHEQMDRYFMTVEEASALVLQAAALNAAQEADQAHIYVLEMGKPVNITQLARNLIRLRGLVPDEDIAIRYTGLRPGEKLSEQLTNLEEMLTPTSVPGVRRFDGCVVDPEGILRNVDSLLEAIERRDRNQIRRTLSRLLKGYVPKDTLDGLPVKHDLPDLTVLPKAGRDARPPRA